MSPTSSPHARAPPSPSPVPEQGGDDNARIEISLQDLLASSPPPTRSSPSSPPQCPHPQHSSATHDTSSSNNSHTQPTFTASIVPDTLASLKESHPAGGLPSSLDTDIRSGTTASCTPTPTPAPSKTPNLYINGLPPNFPEDELYALTSPYGEVRSVRTFTRHVGDRTSGYGFVLFDSVESAEKCIEGLKQCRNLHPSFSKQIHKIPGTTYSVRVTHNGSTSTAGLSDTTSSRSSLPRSGSSNFGDDDNSFKARMERLRDDTSTNLYIEGLPLSIDDATMAALVAPYEIKSSRFFETKLSHPPRIIAFVRLETRSAAEEIIERLHGRMVRGWNDPGSRISVRFADTAEQRELRRTERMTREGEQSPSKLTIAQAALLNLRGQEYQAHISGIPTHPAQVLHHLPSISSTVATPGLAPGFDVNPLRGSAGYAQTSGIDYGHLAMGEYHPQTVQQQQRQLQQHSARFAGRIPMSSLPTSYSPYNLPDVMTPEFNMLLDVQRRATPFNTDHAGFGRNTLDPEYILQSQMPKLGVVQPQQACNGYTPAEELILRAHARVNATRATRPEETHSRKISTSLRSGAGVDIGMGVRAQRSLASTVAYPQRSRIPATLSPNSPMQPLAPMSEDDFTSGTSIHHTRFQPSLMVDTNTRTIRRQDEDIHALSRDFDSILLLQQQQQQLQNIPFSYDSRAPVHTLSEDPNESEQIQAHAPHIRATTLPQSSSSQGGIQHQRHGHYQHNSMSVIDGRRTRQNQMAQPHSDRLEVENSAQTQKLKRNLAQNHSGANFSDSIHTHSGANYASRGDGEQCADARLYDGSRFSLAHGRLAPKFGGGAEKYEQQVAALDNAASPPLVSPALTYSSHSSRTPSSLSPATPFFSSFGHAGEGFEGPAVGLDGKKVVGAGVNVAPSSAGL